jgi:hypothetical protein
MVWFSNLSTMSVHDEGDSKNASCALNLISTGLLYSNGYNALTYPSQSTKGVFVL